MGDSGGFGWDPQTVRSGDPESTTDALPFRGVAKQVIPVSQKLQSLLNNLSTIQSLEDLPEGLCNLIKATARSETFV